MKNVKYKNNLDPIDNDCNCYTCKNFTLAYLHHLFSAQELLGLQLLTNHNIYFMNNLMKEVRSSIDNNDFDNAKKKWLNS